MSNSCICIITLVGFEAQLRLRACETSEMPFDPAFPSPVGSYIPGSNLSLLPGTIPCLPRKEHSHHPSRLLVFCSKTVSMSPFRKANSSGASATLS